MVKVVSKMTYNSRVNAKCWSRLLVLGIFLGFSSTGESVYMNETSVRLLMPVSYVAELCQFVISMNLFNKSTIIGLR